MTAGSTEHPPAPWFLAGRLTLSAWLVPLSQLPPVEVPGWRPVTLAGRAVAGTALARYSAPGVLGYDELMLTVLVRRGLRLAPTVVRIWVDSEASLVGGRALFAVPKERATFRGHVVAAGATALAEVTSTPRMRLPGRWPLRFSLAQPRDGRAVVSPVRARARLSLARVRWRPGAAGALAPLRGRRPLAGLELGELRMAFGGPPRPVGAALSAAATAASHWQARRPGGSMARYDG